MKIARCRDGKAKDCYGYGDPLPSHGCVETLHSGCIAPGGAPALQVTMLCNFECNLLHSLLVLMYVYLPRGM